MFYDTTDKFQVQDAQALREHLRAHPHRYYVYVLCYPPASKRVRPFYVGIGQDERIFAHERDAEDPATHGLKAEIIRAIRAAGNDVLRYLDGIYSEAPWHQEQELISRFGLSKDQTGVLANEQRYSPSFSLEGIELRKYALDGNTLPGNFARRESRLVVGPNKPKSASSVYGKIYATLQRNPGVTGAELVELLLSTDFSDNATAYAQSGQVSRPWLAKYIDGGFYKKNQFIQEASRNLRDTS